jgi:hypothetical protein
MPDKSRSLVTSCAKKAIGALPDPWNILPGIFYRFKQTQGYYPNILFPKTFNEKLQRRKLFDRRPLLTLMADKYAVRNYVRERLPVDFPRLYCVTDNPSDISLKSLPNKFVIKPTHASGWVRIVKDKSLISEGELRDECTKWLARSYYDVSKEWVYKNIPRRLLVEELLEDGTGDVPRDYKFFVFAGKVQLIQVDIDRFRGHRRNLYDRHWNRLDVRFVYDTYGGALPRPNSLAEMIEYAEMLGDGLEFVRVDFYNLGSRVLFGELTITPENGFGKFIPESFDLYLGGLWPTADALPVPVNQNSVSF